MKWKDLVLRICGDCNGPFYGGQTAQYCPECRRKRQGEAARKNAISIDLGKNSSTSRRKGKRK